MGIRIENELVCVHKADNQYGTFLGFEPIMFVPIATSPILPGVLNKDELEWLNDYHRQVFAKLAPHLNDEERELAGREVCRHRLLRKQKTPGAVQEPERLSAAAGCFL